MGTYRLDDLQFSSELPHYLELSDAPTTFDITCSGTVLNTAIAQFTGSASLSSRLVMYKIRAVNVAVDKAAILVSSRDIANVWQYATTELVTTVFPITGTTINMTLSVTNNTGATITIPTQTIRFEIYEYTIAL